MTKTLFLSGIALLITVIVVEDQCERDGKIPDLEAKTNRADTVYVFDTGSTTSCSECCLYPNSLT